MSTARSLAPKFALFALLSAGCGPAPLAGVIHKMQYSELVPASTLTPPGTIVLMRPNGVLEIVCTQEQSLGPNAATLIQGSTSIKEEDKSKLTSTTKLDITALEKLKVQFSAQYIRNITVNLSNVRLQSLSWASAIQGLQGRSPACSTALDDLKKENDSHAPKPLIISEVLQADAAYTIQVDKGVSGSITIPKELLQYLGIAASTEFSSSGTSNVSGTGLYWGYRTMHRETTTKKMGVEPAEVAENLLQDLAADTDGAFRTSSIKSRSQ